MTEGRCGTFAGSDRCELRVGHAGAHHTMWGEYGQHAQRRQERPGRDESMKTGTYKGEQISDAKQPLSGTSVVELTDGGNRS